MRPKLLTIFLIFFCSLSAGAAADLRVAGVSDEMSRPEFFIDRAHNPKEILTTWAQIEKINIDTMSSPKTFMNDLGAMPAVMDAKTLVKELSSFDINPECYINGKKVTDRFYNKIRNNIRNKTARERQPLKYGFFVRRSSVKLLPVEETVSDAPDDPEFDTFQTTAGYVAEPVVIAAETNDSKWLYVYLNNCNGWVKAEDIAVCKTKREWRRYKDSENILLVTGDRFSLEQSVHEPRISGLELYMGTTLPLVAQAAEKTAGRVPYFNHIVLIPTRNEDGTCGFKQAPVPYNRDVRIGYLPYTTENLVRQMFKRLGNRYGWGGMLKAEDCSSYVMSVYRCFGFHLPRNSAWQAQAVARELDLDGLASGEKSALIRALPLGSLLQLKGHIMMLLGSVNEDIYVISATGSFFPGHDIVRTRTVVINSLDVKRANGHTWLEEMLRAVSLVR